MITCLFCMITSVIFWINPNILYGKCRPSRITPMFPKFNQVNFFKVIEVAQYSPIIIVSCCLLSCALLWILVLQYAIRLGINNDVRLIVIILVCVDAVLEFGCAIMIVISNLYCTELLDLPILFGFSYSKFFGFEL